MGLTGAALPPRTAGLVDALLAEARSTLVRLGPRLALRAQREGGLLVDIRPQEQRRREGAIPGAVVVDRNVLEWRLEPSSAWRIPELVDRRQVVVLFCSAGYASSLAAASVQRLGLVNATDMIGGFLAWRRAGLPVVE
ncbi:MAG TPA: rhodanese-like domain-containing protein [Candidatus Dormibacteraeota bacterium]|jgi:rhodanese-related sulfurtransferase|nr:rhodanese-like domain-containing protein [Candidatus Dormibacteraeota bacterium]